MRVPTTLYADLICPFCYLAAFPFGRLRAEGLIDLRVRPFEIHPETPREGIDLEALDGKAKAKVDEVWRSLQWLAGEAGVEIRRPSRLPQSRLALEALEMARAAKGDAGAVDFMGRAFGAYFREGADLADEALLRGIADQVGVPRPLQEKCFLGRAFGPSVDAARREAEDAMVTAVPGGVVGGFPVVGYQAYPQLKKLVERAGKRA